MDAIFDLIGKVFNPILEMGGPVIMLIILTVLALLFGVKFSKALEGGIKLAIALTGIGAIIGMLNGAFSATDIVHNLAEKVVVVRLEKPVTFHNMIAPDKEVEVSLLFFIINNSSSSQTNILAQLMDFFTGNGHLEDLSKISEPEKLYAYIDEAIA
ncbi:phosphotransferase system sugar-specific EII component [Streptococcus pneumoniae]|nr:phosphotransferase system sugar-specific EII component [Streptococcus pneumoniae]CIU40453.1 phosphotransferase system sugar-specific EII component [Streptococcus pneumoniae]CJM64352.1 phosphotransferase system sugar-specific EII component [Streptococcus pneumoniae]